MGVENNECIVATTWDDEAIKQLREWIIRLEGKDAARFAMTYSIVNNKKTIFMGPDGSKKGWSEAEHGEKLRQQFIDFLKSFDYEDGSSPWNWVEVGYGEFGQKVLRGNCKNCYSDDEYYTGS